MLESVLPMLRRTRLLSGAVAVAAAAVLTFLPVTVDGTGITATTAACQGGCHVSENDVCLWNQSGAEGYACTGGACDTCSSGEGFCFDAYGGVFLNKRLEVE